jgi:hypothetical protein
MANLTKPSGIFCLGRLRRMCLRLALVAGVLLGTRLHASPPNAVNVLATTTPNTPVTIQLLTNDSDPGNQMAILQVGAPLHGSVTINSNGAVLTSQLSNLFSFAAVQLSNSVTLIGATNVYPRSTMTNGNGQWKLSQSNDWIVGFFPGAMWYVYQQTGDTNFKKWAQEWTTGITSQQFVTNTDDVGFMLNCSFGTGYRVTGNTNLTYKAAILQTAHSFTNRYDSVIHVLADDRNVTPFEVIMDTMMNTEVLYHATDINGDTTISSKAFNHAVRAMTNQIRSDGSTFQLVDYNANTGALTYQGTRAGQSQYSTWARGQGWATYGFTMAYRETTNLQFLTAAQQTANYYISNAPSDYVPYWDFQADGIPNAPRDSSAAAITLSALIQLGELTTNMTDSAADWLEAYNIFQSLASTNYLAAGSNSRGILLHGTGESPVQFDPEINVSLIYGDYYFVEAMRRYAEAYSFTNVTYTPKTGFYGTDSFTYQVCDSAGQCSTAAVTVVVLNTNQLAPFSASISLAPVTRIPAISFPSSAGYVYQVDYLNSLQSPVSWNVLASNLVGSGSTISVNDSNLQPQRFYRAGAK